MPVVDETSFLPAGSRHNLIAATEAACADIWDKIAYESNFELPALTPQDANALILESVYATLERFARRHNENQLISRLPTELMGVALEFLDSAHDRLQAALSCRLWHQLIFSNPSAWRHITFIQPNHRGLANQLKLSGSVPLTLVLRLTPKNWVEVCDCLPLALERCVRLSLYVQLETDGASASHTIISTLLSPAPMLRDLTVLDLDHVLDIGDYPSFEDMFGSQARLKVAKLDTDLRSWSTVAPSVFQDVEFAALAQGHRTWDLEHLQMVLSLFPNAKNFALEIGSWESVDEVPPNDDERVEPAARRTCTLPRGLDILTFVMTNGSVSPQEALSGLGSSQARICVSYNVRPSIEAAQCILDMFAGDLAAEGIKTVRIEASAYDNAAFNIFLHTAARDAHASTHDAPTAQQPPLAHRIILDLPMQISFPGAVFTHMTRLYLSELILGLCELPEAPLLEQLTIQTITPIYQLEDNPDSIFSLPRTRDRVLRCPRLQVLRFAARVRDGTQRFAPEMVQDFVEWHLQYSAPKLRLKLIGVEILEGRIDALISMLALFDQVDVEPGRMKWQPSEIMEIQW
ncbi:hypothetical protein BKA62DRAFT_701364 [Auriculariales sp. MPI-PUGE-AT-0066]|nr:hypothetical protein BKA62DRAFT_701364 [Auriculariales sp. MPI-PUGE-AT-0066]